MKRPPLHPYSSLRIFGPSAFLTVAALAGMAIGKGFNAMVVAVVLVAVEIAFSFDNAIVNAKVLGKLSHFWQNMFLTVGALIAIFGMRIVFPIIIVMFTADLNWGRVWDLALHHPPEYADRLVSAHPTLSAFGAAFLLMLALHFFVDETREVRWFQRLERALQRLTTVWAPPLITAIIVAGVSLLPANHYKRETLIAGLTGIALYALMHALIQHLETVQGRRLGAAALVRTGAAAFVTFLYLEVLDASFSFDSVLGAFAVTKDVILIAVGLGVGALWVRSLTIFIVRRGTLNSYKYIDHGAHYTIGALALILFVSLFVDVPEVITGLTGIGIIGASLTASRQALAHKGASS